MADISSVKVNGTEYDIRDTETFIRQKLLADGIPDTTQEYTFENDQVTTVLHKSGNTTIRTDAFTYATGSITEVRTLNTGESLTIVTNLSTLATTITYGSNV